MNRLFVAAVVLVASVRLSHADKCRDYLVTRAADAAVMTAVYWNGTKLDYLKGSAKSGRQGEILFYFSEKQVPRAGDLRLPAGTEIREGDIGPEEQGPCPNKLLAWSFKPLPKDPTPPVPPPEKLPEVVTITDYVTAYRSPPKIKLEANGATSIASEAAQILGQIVVNRASEAAYSLLMKKAKKWLRCGGDTRLPATCEVLESLRMQDLAMAPDQLRASLASDALKLVDLVRRKVLSKTKLGFAPIVQPVFAASEGSAEPAGATRCQETSGPDGLRCAVNNMLEDQLVPILARPVSSLTDHPAEAMIRRLVDKGLNKLEDKGQAKLCTLYDRDRILALVAVSFAACKVNTDKCEIMSVVEQLNATTCAEKLSDDHLAYAQSVAGHFWQAVSLKNNANSSDDAKRLIAALEGTFEVACMYAGAAAGPYKCELQKDKHDETELVPSESVAIARDVMIAAASRNGAALGRAFIAALTRVLPPAESKETSRGLRVLATITAYATTYTGTSASSDEAHKQRTSLLDSLTRDMTNRTERGGDTIISVGGSLRVMGGWRVSQERVNVGTGKPTRDWAYTPPLSLPLGFGVDWLNDGENTGGVHLEIGLLDLGQYLTWDSGGKVATPELISALSPSLTIGKSWYRELPFFLGLTVGYTPSFDFSTTNDQDRKGALNFGLTAGVYVPLFDFN